MKKRDNTPPAQWSKEQLEQRRQQMESLHPGYLEMNTWMYVFFVTVLMFRFLYLGLLMILGQEYTVISSAVNLLFCFFMYRYMLKLTYKISILFLLMRSIELLSLIPVWLSIFDYNFFGILLNVTLVVALLVDLAYLVCVTFVKPVREMISYNQIVHSGQRVKLYVSKEEMGDVAEPDLTEADDGMAETNQLTESQQDAPTQ